MLFLYFDVDKNIVLPTAIVQSAGVKVSVRTQRETPPPFLKHALTPNFRDTTRAVQFKKIAKGDFAS